MAVGTLVSFAIQAVIMLIMLDRRVGGLDLKYLMKPIGKMLIATVVMGIILWAIKHSPLYPSGLGRMIWLMQLMLMLIVGAAIYLAASWIMRLDTLSQLTSSRRRA
jgi:peptidoglycan biosynthesis protein MviN/MurJ (putative lipid II flippase)